MNDFKESSIVAMEVVARVKARQDCSEIEPFLHTIMPLRDLRSIITQYREEADPFYWFEEELFCSPFVTSEAGRDYLFDSPNTFLAEYCQNTLKFIKRSRAAGLFADEDVLRFAFEIGQRGCSRVRCVYSDRCHCSKPLTAYYIANHKRTRN